jgi:hypothetical protein
MKNVTETIEVKKNIIAPTPTEVEQLKRKYGRVYTIVCADDETEFHFLFKELSRDMLGIAFQTSAENPLDASYTMTINTLVWGNKDLLDNAAIFLKVSEKLQEQLNSFSAQLKKS